MDAQPVLSFHRSVARQPGNHENIGVPSLYLPSLSTTQEEKYPKLPNNQVVFAERELMSSPSDVGPLSYDKGTVGHILSGYSKDCHSSNDSPNEKHSETQTANAETTLLVHDTSAGISMDLHVFNASPREKHLEKGPFSSQTSVIVHSSCHQALGVLQSTSTSCYTIENNDSWCSDMIPDFVDYAVMAEGSNYTEDGNISSCVGLSEDCSMSSDLLNQLLNDDDALTSNWNHIENNGFINSELQVRFHEKNMSVEFLVACGKYG